MKLKNLKQEEIESMSYDDLAFLILQENKKKMKINDLFKKVCNLMKLDDNVFETKIADFFELLSTDKKFIMLENGFWDLKEKHSNRVTIETDEEESLELEDLDIEDFEEDEEEDEIFYDEEDNDDTEDDLKDLVIIDEDEEETNS